MNLRKLKDEDLINHTLQLTGSERGILVSTIHCLREIERRRLFSSFGYRSLFDFAVRKLKYPEDQAQRRIIAMRLVRKVPEVQPLIESGDLSLTSIGLAQQHIQREEKLRANSFSRSEILNVIQIVAGKSVREAEKNLLKISNYKTLPKPDSTKRLNKDLVEIKMTVTQADWENAEKLLGLMAHLHPNLSLGGLFGITCRLAVDIWTTYPPAPPRVAPRKSPLHREVWERDQGKCTNCGSAHALQVDHIHPKALGGEDTLENLRLLCRNCNQRAAIEIFGVDKMEEFLN